MQPTDSAETIALAIRGGQRLPHGSHLWPNVQAAHRILLRDRLDSLWEPEFADGRGIVTCGGGEAYFPSVWVLLRSLRHMGCRLPVEVWHLGEEEMDPYMRTLIREWGAMPVDAVRLSRAVPRRNLAGWELKLFAIGCSAFREVLFLDADCMPLRDPEECFRWPEYLRSGLFVWPDFPTWHQPASSWKIVLGRVPDDCVPAVSQSEVHLWYGRQTPRDQRFNLETGQLLIDKQRAWGAWLVADFFCQHSDFYFWHLHGDCGAWLTAIEAVQADHALAPWLPDWVDPHTIIQFDTQREPLFAHRTLDKWRLRKPPRPASRPLLSQELGTRFLRELEEIWPGRLWVNYRPTMVERMLRRDLEGRWALWRRLGAFQVLFQFGPRGEIAMAPDRRLTHWDVFVEDGTPLLVLRNESGCMARLACQSGRLSWVGRMADGHPSDLTIIANATSPPRPADHSPRPEPVCEKVLAAASSGDGIGSSTDGASS